MPRRCTVCQHKDHERIDQLLVRGGTVTRTAALFGVSQDALARHKRRHIPEKLRLAQDEQEEFKAQGLMTEVRELHAKTLALLAQCEEAGDLRAALIAVREARGNLDLIGKLFETKELEEKLANLEQGLGADGRHVPDFVVVVESDGDDK